MAYDETLGQRLRVAMEAECSDQALTEKRMFGGLALLVNGNMACGIVGDKLMVRVGAETHDECLTLPHTSPMDFTGKPMKGFVFVWPEGTATARDLKNWVKRGVGYASSLPKK